VSIYAYTLIQEEDIVSPFVPTPVPTRSAHFYLMEADTFYLEGNLEGAITAYEQAISLAPDEVPYYIPLIRLLALEGWVHSDLAERAIELGQHAVERAPNYAPAWAVLGMAYDWSGQVNESIDACLRAVDLDPTYADAYAYLAEAYADAGQWADAQEAAQTALSLAPDSVDANRAHGYVIEGLGNYWGAAESYRRALEIHPKLAHIYVDLGRAYQYLYDTSNAIDAYRMATELDQDRAEAFDKLAWTYYAIGDQEMARTYLERAIEVDSEYAPAYGHLAILYWARRYYEEAIPNLEKAINLSYRVTRRSATGFYVTTEPTEESYLYPSGEVVLEGSLTWADLDEIRLAASLEPLRTDSEWAGASGRVTLNTVTGEYILRLENVPALPYGRVYVGWFEGLDDLNGMAFNTGPLLIRAAGNFEARLLAEPIDGPRIEELYILGLCYYYMDQCDRAYPLFNAALKIDPEEPNALEGIRLCQELESESP
jgi:tetratricopeptide (TPR) repeat protein